MSKPKAKVVAPGTVVLRKVHAAPTRAHAELYKQRVVRQRYLDRLGREQRRMPLLRGGPRLTMSAALTVMRTHVAEVHARNSIPAI